MTNLIKKIAAMAAAVMMMGTMTIGASAKTLTPILESENNEGYWSKIQARNNNFSVSKCRTEVMNPKTHKYIPKIYSNNIVPNYPVKYHITGNKSSTCVSLTTFRNSGKALKLNTEIEIYNSTTKKLKYYRNSIKTKTTGCGTSINRRANNKYYKYTLSATVSQIGDVDPMTSRNLTLIVNQNK